MTLQPCDPTKNSTFIVRKFDVEQIDEGPEYALSGFMGISKMESPFKV